jgi:hypothetical protein
MPLSVAAAQGEDFHTVLRPNSQPLVRLYSMEDLEEIRRKAGLTDPIKLA